ncbi:hypothetical protein CALCODRAFT_487296 [Calocera cornea HHB12733]|uniref:Uncharacterized protein n=1 Tax=Calocera cornea HHB12733 TaxID=1353952 RepID=A0A165CZ21_9BASI|nr:hypothetical protein CALCODRAFT_487725 [Calocera cornea HHB12733]KZT52252.1 hypothetical protein CALCODRAFT_487296 [Calocera cornea HHB12733]
MEELAAYVGRHRLSEHLYARRQSQWYADAQRFEWDATRRGDWAFVYQRMQDLYKMIKAEERLWAPGRTEEAECRSEINRYLYTYSITSLLQDWFDCDPTRQQALRAYVRTRIPTGANGRLRAPADDLGWEAVGDPDADTIAEIFDLGPITYYDLSGQVAQFTLRSRITEWDRASRSSKTSFLIDHVNSDGSHEEMKVGMDRLFGMYSRRMGA